MVLLLDYERIIVDINPNSGINVESVKKLGERERSNKKIVIAEDSPLLRKLLHDTLYEAGYVNLEFFENGKDALSILRRFRKCFTNIYGTSSNDRDGHRNASNGWTCFNEKN